MISKHAYNTDDLDELSPTTIFKVEDSESKMASTRKGSVQGTGSGSGSNFNRNAMKWNRSLSAADGQTPQATRTGVKPVTDPMSVQQICVVLVLHVCRKVLVWERLVQKVAIYGAVLLFGSVLCDFFPLPRNHLWRKSGILNSYFAKFCWGWTVCILGAYIGLTSFVYCCGVASGIRRHLSRLLVSTVVWYVWTTAFVYLESATGICIGDSTDRTGVEALSREACFKRGLRWRGFDVSGHVFMLIYCCLIIHEEAKSIKGWERLKDLIRNVDYDQDSPMEALSADQVELLRKSYERFSPYVRGLFVAMTALCLIWDFQVLGTILYYHSMAQKVSAGLIAVFTWFITYRVWYLAELSPGLPGQGAFKMTVDSATVSGGSTEAKDRRRQLNTAVVTPRAKLWRNGMSAGEHKSE